VAGRKDKLPIGLQLVGRWHDDRFLLDVAEKLEAACAEQVRVCCFLV
jgi:Asp-tRNA(Asn)/Glu-tRNA(Gln) amidotransferase A subunit family amidase